MDRLRPESLYVVQLTLLTKGPNTARILSLEWSQFLMNYAFVRIQSSVSTKIAVTAFFGVLMAAQLEMEVLDEFREVPLSLERRLFTSST